MFERKWEINFITYKYGPTKYDKKKIDEENPSEYLLEKLDELLLELEK